MYARLRKDRQSRVTGVTGQPIVSKGMKPFEKIINLSDTLLTHYQKNIQMSVAN